MSRETIKANVIDAPTLFVGVGGTGCKIITRVAEMCKPEETENINFIGFDTNVNDLKNVTKSGAFIYRVQTSNPQTVGNYLENDANAAHNWFPTSPVLFDKTVSEGAGQVRAISRLAFNDTVKTGKIQPLYDAIDDLFRKRGKEFRQAMRVVIATTASGGTGSGMMLPISMFIRDYVKNKYPNTGIIIRALVMLPETLDSVISSATERDSQRRNAYATIKELNAFMMKGSGFLDTDEDLKRYKNIHIDMAVQGSKELKELSQLPVDFCFLMDGQNAEDNTLTNLEQYIIQASQALYEQNVGPMQLDAFSVEDNIIKELAEPGNKGRNRFGGIGASVLRYPYEAVSEYIACTWAMDSIGGEGEASKWGKYDNAYKVKFMEAKKRGIPKSEGPTLEGVYCDTLDTRNDAFSVDVRNTYLRFAEGGADQRIDVYFGMVYDRIRSIVEENPVLAGAQMDADFLGRKIDYSNPSNQGKAGENLNLLRTYEEAVKTFAKKLAENAAESLFINEEKTINVTDDVLLEKLLKNSYDASFHPVAARYMLYRLKSRLANEITGAEAEVAGQKETLFRYSDNNSDEKLFDVAYTRKTQETTLQELVDAEKESLSMVDKMNPKYKDLFDQLNKHFVAYHNAISVLQEATIKLAVYKTLYAYVEDLCKEYEAFFQTFKVKVKELERRKDDIAEALVFHKGDSIYNVCCTKDMMEEMARESGSEGGSELSSELNAAIFDAVKANVRFAREIRYADVVEEDRRIDIFDGIIIDSFIDDVRTNCAAVDMNIVEALMKQYRLEQRLRLRKESSGEGKIFDHVTTKGGEQYVQDLIAIGQRLAAPSIQRISHVEPREIRLCVYNKELDDMRSVRMKDMFAKGISVKGVDTISRYEMHFFNALYNLTPDKLKKFACAKHTETGEQSAGLYHNAYESYSKRLGPDSTKNSSTTTHIDKRWDSIAVLPEMDFGYQKTRMMRIHQAMIYGLVHEMITFRRYSEASGDKRVYRYYNSEEYFEDLVVSNGTLCDEFYEILDAMYMNSSMVGDINVIRRQKSKRDTEHHSRYENTVFAQDVASFALPSIHAGAASLLEIPLVYYNSLPNMKRYMGEINDLAAAVVEVFRQEISSYENETNAHFILCDVLVQQFKLFMENYAKYEVLHDSLPAADNMVVDVIYRKVKAVLETPPEPADYEKILHAMKMAIRSHEIP